MSVIQKICSCLLQAIVLLGLVVLSLWLILHPIQPSYTITELSIPNTGDADCTLLHCTLEIKNRDKYSSIHFDDIVLTFYYGQDKLGNSTVPSFKQEEYRTREVLNSVNVNPGAWGALVKALSNTTATTTVELKVSLLTTIQYNTSGLKSRHHAANLEGSVPIGSDGKISTKKKKIKLHKVSKK